MAKRTGGGDATSTKKRQRTSKKNSSSPVQVETRASPAGYYLPHEIQRPISDGGVDAGATVLGIPIPVQLMCPGGCSELRMGAYIGSKENHCVMNLALWLIRCANSIGLTCYLESVLDDETLNATGQIVVLRARLFVPVPRECAEPLLGMMQASFGLTPNAPDPDMPAAGGRASPVASASAASAEPMGGWAAASRSPASALHIDSVASFMSAVAVCVGRPDCADADDELALDFDVPGHFDADTTDAFHLLAGDGDDAEESAALDAALTSDGHVSEALGHTFPGRSPFTLLSADNTLFSESLIANDQMHGAHADQVDQDLYLRDGRLMFPALCRESDGVIPPRVFVLNPRPGWIGTADELMNFNWPMSLAPARTMVNACRRMFDYRTERCPKELMQSTTVDEVRSFLDTLTSRSSRGLRYRPELISASDFPYRNSAPARFCFPLDLIWPIQAAAAQHNHRVLSRTAEALEDADATGMTPEKANQILRRQLMSSVRLMTTDTEGVEPTYMLLQRDLEESIEFVEYEETDAAFMSRELFFELPEASPKTPELPESRPMPLLSRIMGQIVAHVMQYLELGPAQVCGFMPVYVIGFGFGGDVFNQLQPNVMCRGPPGAGKSWMFERLGMCIPPSLWNPDDIVTAGAATMQRRRGYRYSDEQNNNTVTSSGKSSKAAAETVADRAILKKMSGGFTKGSRMAFDSRRNGKDVAREHQWATDDRGACVASGNGEYNQPFMDRCLAILMPTVDETGGSAPDRRELTVSAGGDNSNNRGTCSFLQYFMALANRMWIPFASGCMMRFDTTMVEIFYGLAVKILKPAGFQFPQCRVLCMMRRSAQCYTMMRLTTLWDRISGLSLEHRNAGRDKFFLANAVVSGEDVLQAFFDVIGLTDTRGEESALLKALKANILEDPFGPKVGTHKTHYVTNLKGIEGLGGLSNACQTLGASIVQSVLPKLQYSSSSGVGKVGIEPKGDEKGHWTISMDAAHDPNCLTPAQDAIMTFLEEVIVNPPAGVQGRLWFPEVGDQGRETGAIVFVSAVLRRILGSSSLDAGKWPGAFKTVAQSDRLNAMNMFKRASLMRWAEDGSSTPENAKVALVHMIPAHGTRRADLGGLLDQGTVLSAAPGYQDALADASALLSADDAAGHQDGPLVVEPSPEQAAEWLGQLASAPPSVLGAQVPPKRMPADRPLVSTVERHAVLVVKPALPRLRRAVDAAKAMACNVAPPPKLNDHEGIERAFQRLIDVLFAVSGDASPGQDVYCGPSITAREGIKWRRIGRFDGTISIKNPRRRAVQNSSLLVKSASAASARGARRNSRGGRRSRGSRGSRGSRRSRASAAREAAEAAVAEADATLAQEEIAQVQAASESILPSDRAVVVLRSGSKLYQRLLRETRAINLPGCDPIDDQVPDPDDEPPEFIEAHPATLVSGDDDSGGSPVPTTSAAHALQFRAVLRRSGDESDDGASAFEI